MRYEKLGNLINDRITGEWGTEPISTGVKVIRTTNFTNDGQLDLTNVVERDVEEKKVKKKALKRGDLIIEKSGGGPTQPVGRVVYFDVDSEEHYLCNNFTAILRPNSSVVHSKYLLYQMLFLHKSGRTKKYQNKTTGIHNLNLEKYLQEEIAVPPLSDQLRIADILSRAERLIAKRKESIRLLDEYLKSMFLEMFGDPVRNERGWGVYTFEDFTTRVTKGESPKWQGYDYLQSGVRFVTSENVLWGDVDLEKAKYIHEDFHRKLKRSQLHEGDMLVNLVGASVGRTAMCPKNALPANINQAVAAITLKKGKVISSYVLFLFINQSFQRMMLGNVVEAARANLSLSDIRNLKIPVPPIELQTKFAKIVEKTEALKAQYHLSLQGLENLYGGLSQRAFRGDLVKIA